jgi:hypothetical protein
MTEPPAAFTPADVLRRVTALGVLVNLTTVWAYVRARLAAEFPERAATARPDELPVAAATLTDWLEDFLDTTEAERSRLTRNLNPE